MDIHFDMITWRSESSHQTLNNKVIHLIGELSQTIVIEDFDLRTTYHCVKLRIKLGELHP
jgi:CTP synthase (UTP-ammonia lyase)